MLAAFASGLSGRSISPFRMDLYSLRRPAISPLTSSRRINRHTQKRIFIWFSESWEKGKMKELVVPQIAAKNVCKVERKIFLVVIL